MNINAVTKNFPAYLIVVARLPYLYSWGQNQAAPLIHLAVCGRRPHVYVPSTLWLVYHTLQVSLKMVLESLY